MRRWLSAIVAVVAVLASLLPMAVFAQTPEPVVEGILFFSESCPHCQAVINEFLPKMVARYGERVSIELATVSDATNYMVLQELDKLYAVPDDQRGVPELFIGRSVMVGRYSIEDNFEKVVDDYLSHGGLNMPDVSALRRQLQQAHATQTAEPVASQAASVGTTPQPTAVGAGEPIHMVYLYQDGCQECERVQYDLQALQQLYPQLEIERYPVSENGALAEWLGDRFGVPEDRRLLTPALFVGTDYVVGESVTYDELDALLRKYSSTGAARAWGNWKQDQAGSEERVISRFRSFGLLTLVSAGLIDGVNPCAFATMIFFVSYLGVTGRGKRQILVAGLAFTVGVFATYMLLGLGLFRLATYVTGLSRLAQAIYGITAVACFAFAALSLGDFLRARRGDRDSMRLRLPTRLRRIVNRSIRETMKPGTVVLTALVTGAVVSSVELVCTGQIYLPTIMFVASHPELRLKAVGALTLYNLAFVTPLIVVFAFAAFGSDSDRLRVFLARHTATLKLLTALVLLALGVWLLALMIRAA